MPKVLDGALEIGKADSLIDQQPFYLMEHRRVGQIGVAAVNPPGTDNADRRRLRLHGAHLDRRGVGTQQPGGIKVKSIRHAPRRMVRRNIERDRKSTRLNSSHVASSYAVF